MQTLNLKDNPVQVGQNVMAAKSEDGKLVLIIDLSVDLGLSGSGKSRMIATTSGNVAIGLAKLGLNLYKKTD